MPAPIVAVRKTLQDGRACTITAEVDHGAAAAVTTIGDERMGRASQAFPLDKPAAPGITHAVWAGTAKVGLTTDEATAVNRAVRQLEQELAAERRALQAETARRARAAAPKAATWQVQAGEGNGGRPYRVGETFRDQDDAQRRIVTVLEASQRYYADDGMSFGVGADQGHVYTAVVREATVEEASPIIGAEQRAQRGEELRTAAREQFAWLYSTTTDATVPDEVSPSVLILPRVVIGPKARGWSTRESFLAVDEQGGVVYSLSYNGADGDDWSHNNLPGYVVAAQPLTRQRADLIAQLREHFGDRQPV
jgi:hypothetical protein